MLERCWSVMQKCVASRQYQWPSVRFEGCPSSIPRRAHQNSDIALNPSTSARHRQCIARITFPASPSSYVVPPSTARAQTGRASERERGGLRVHGLPLWAVGGGRVMGRRGAGCMCCTRGEREGFVMFNSSIQLSISGANDIRGRDITAVGLWHVVLSQWARTEQSVCPPCRTPSTINPHHTPIHCHRHHATTAQQHTTTASPGLKVMIRVSHLIMTDCRCLAPPIQLGPHPPALPSITARHSSLPATAQHSTHSPHIPHPVSFSTHHDTGSDQPPKWLFAEGGNTRRRGGGVALRGEGRGGGGGGR